MNSKKQNDYEKYGRFIRDGREFIITRPWLNIFQMTDMEYSCPKQAEDSAS